jgi:hypothetical protein
MYKVIEYFEDLQDNGFAYNVGDEYPRKGLEVTKGRIEELATTQNRRKTPLIKKVETKPKKPKKADKE